MPDKDDYFVLRITSDTKRRYRKQEQKAKGDFSHKVLTIWTLDFYYSSL